MVHGRRTDRALTAAGARSDTSPAFTLHGITKTFGNVVALNDVSFAAHRHRITALLGENGAGKTTLMRIAFGMLQPDVGSITVDGIQRSFRSPSDAIAAGVGMVHQQFSLVPEMTVAENLALGGHGLYSFNDVARSLAEASQRTSLKLDPSKKVHDLSNAERQKLEILRTFVHKAQIVILDEPTSVLTALDRAELFRELRAFAERGNCIVLITHKLRDALEHSDDIIVLRRGKVALSAPAESLGEESLAAAMLGTTSPPQRPHEPTGDTVVRPIARLEKVVLRKSTSTAPHGEIDLEINGGEIIGVAALEGGAVELLRVLSGRSTPQSGTPTVPANPAFVPENRSVEALIDAFTLSENLALAGAASRGGIIDWKYVEDETDKLLSEYQILPADPKAYPRELSGGNQQRFVVGREIRNNPSLIVLENPTQGLDINASGFVHAQTRRAKERGAAVVFYSADIDELAELCDRVLIVSSKGLKSVAPDRNAIGAELLDVAGKT